MQGESTTARAVRLLSWIAVACGLITVGSAIGDIVVGLTGSTDVATAETVFGINGTAVLGVLAVVEGFLGVQAAAGRYDCLHLFLLLVVVCIIVAAFNLLGAPDGLSPASPNAYAPVTMIIVNVIAAVFALKLRKEF